LRQGDVVREMNPQPDALFLGDRHEASRISRGRSPNQTHMSLPGDRAK
jgi:hypothetical protein